MLVAAVLQMGIMPGDSQGPCLGSQTSGRMGHFPQILLSPFTELSFSILSSLAGKGLLLLINHAQ